MPANASMMVASVAFEAEIMGSRQGFLRCRHWQGTEPVAPAGI
jgi:hypothetical protein